MTAMEYAENERNNGYGCALFDRETGKILTPYFGSWHDEEDFPEITDWEIDEVKASGTSFYLGRHSGCYEEQYYEQRRIEKEEIND